MRKKIFFLFFTFLQLAADLPIEKVIIWGHKLHSHTHSYIHERFFRAFKYMGYPTYWFDDSDDVSNFDFTHSLFITEGQVDDNIPLRLDCRYILHNCTKDKYRPLFEASRAYVMQTYTDGILSIPHLLQVEPFIYYDIPGRCVYFPWASDYLPEEIEACKQEVLHRKVRKFRRVYWIGTIGSSDTPHGNSRQIADFTRASAENQIGFRHYNPWSKGLGRGECAKLYKSGYFAPALVGTWQEENGYIPCRIFIAISSGQMGLTNSYRAYELFDKKIVYNPDCYQLVYDALEEEKTWTIQKQIELMDFIKEKHTYLNRIQTLLHFISLCESL